MKKDKCVFENNKECTDCGDCDTCDLNPKEKCNNCGDCLSKGEFDSKAIRIDEIETSEDDLDLELERIKDEQGNEILDLFKENDIDLDCIESALKQSLKEDEYKKAKEFLDSHKDLYSDYNPDNVEFIEDIDNLNEVLQTEEVFKKCAEEIFPGFIKLKSQKKDKDNKKTHLN